VSYRVHIKTSAKDSGRIEINESDFSLTVDEILKKANIPWTGTKKGQLTHDKTSKPISTNDSLQRLGIHPPSQTYNLAFKIPTKTTVVQPTITITQRPVKPHKSGAFEQLKMDLRVFLDESNVVQVNCRGQSREFKGDTELTIKSVDFNRMTVDELLSKLGRKWPILEPEGWLQTTEKTTPIIGTDKLTAIGIIPNPDHTNSFSVVFPVSDEKHPPSDNIARPGIKNPSSGNIQPTTASKGTSESTVGVNVRMFYDDPYYNIQLNGIFSSGNAMTGDVRVEADLTLKKSDYENITFGDLKKKIR